MWQILPLSCKVKFYKLAVNLVCYILLVKRAILEASESLLIETTSTVSIKNHFPVLMHVSLEPRGKTLI